MAQSNAVAQAAALAMFNGQANSLAAMSRTGAVATVTITNPSNNVLNRTVQVCYTAAEQTLFAGVLNNSTLSLGGCSTANAQVPPNIDFYLLLDNSPSMSLPATAAGITAMQNLTTASGSCAFACHQAGTNNGDTNGNPCNAGSTLTNLGNGTSYCTTTTNTKCGDGSSPTKATYSSKTYYYCAMGQQIDNYALARQNNITLRLDELTSAVQTMMATAQTTINTTPYNPAPVYRFAANSMDSLWQIGFTNLMALTTNFSTAWTTASANFGVMEMYSNDNGCANAACSSGSGVADVATNYDNALSSANAQMPTPGNGTNQSGDKPQEVLFFVTDGVEDELNGGIRLIQLINGGVATNYCTQIKNRGIKIAILYTEYLPVPVNSFYVSNVEPFQPNIGTALQACASPGLYYDAAVGSDLGAALSSLFQSAVHSASLTQ